MLLPANFLSRQTSSVPGRRTAFPSIAFQACVLLGLWIGFACLAAIASYFGNSSDALHPGHLPFRFQTVSPGIPQTGLETISHKLDQDIRPAPIAEYPESDLPSLSEFIASVYDGTKYQVRGMYVPGLMALKVIQQPSGNYTFVSEEPDTVTQFQNAAFYSRIGMLAHNHLAGQLFYSLYEGQGIILVMGDATTSFYQVTGRFTFQKESPETLWSDYIDLSTGEKLTMEQLFNRFYRGEHPLILQTCLEREGILTWGLIFITADPLDFGN